MSGVARCAALWIGVAGTGLLLVGSLALAQPPSRVVVLGASEQDPTIARLRREIAILGIDVELVTVTGDDHPELAAVARAHHASAAVALTVSPPGIVVWIDPARSPAGTAGAEIRVDEATTGSAEPRLLVLRAVEILRERLLPAPVLPPSAPDAAPPPAPSGSMSAPPVASTRAPPSDRGPSLFLGPAVLASPGGLGPTPPVWLGARWAPLARLDLEVVAFVPTAVASVSAMQGSMSLRVGALAAGVAFKVTEPPSNVFVTAGAGLGAMFAGYQGQALPPWQSASGVRASLLPYAHASGGYWFTPRVAVRGDIMIGFALPQPVLSIAGDRVAVFGEPAAVFAAALEVRP